MDFYELLNQANMLTNDTISELDAIIDKALSISLDLPSYDIAKEKPKVFYKLYGDITSQYQDVNQGILKANHLLLTLKELTTKIANTKTVNYTIIKDAIAQLKMNINKINEKLTAVRDFKDSLHYTLKFYQNLSYITTLPY